MHHTTVSIEDPSPKASHSELKQPSHAYSLIVASQEMYTWRGKVDFHSLKVLREHGVIEDGELSIPFGSSLSTLSYKPQVELDASECLSNLALLQDTCKVAPWSRSSCRIPTSITVLMQQMQLPGCLDCLHLWLSTMLAQASCDLCRTLCRISLQCSCSLIIVPLIPSCI